MDDWEIAEGSGWIDLPGYGRINPRRDVEDGGRQYFTAKTEEETYVTAKGPGISKGPQTWHFMPDESFWLSSDKWSLEVESTSPAATSFAIVRRTTAGLSDNSVAILPPVTSAGALKAIITIAWVPTAND